MTIVYVGMVLDGIHPGHVNIIMKARKLGLVIIGLLTDEAVKSYKGKPVLNYKQREFMAKNIIRGVFRVVPQNTLDYVFNLKKYRPDILIHGDDWKNGIQKETRDRAKEAVEKYGGRLVEVAYTKGISSTEYKRRIIENAKKKKRKR